MGVEIRGGGVPPPLYEGETRPGRRRVGPRPSLSPQVDQSDAVGPPSPASLGSSHASLASKVERLERSVAQISEAMAMQSKAISEQCLLLQAVLQKAGQHNGGSQQAPVRVAPTEIEVTM